MAGLYDKDTDTLTPAETRFAIATAPERSFRLVVVQG
jgi:hypothetical protein